MNSGSSCLQAYLAGIRETLVKLRRLMAYNYETADHKKQKKNMVLVFAYHFFDIGLQGLLMYGQWSRTDKR